jgi:hypothetical protein
MAKKVVWFLLIAVLLIGAVPINSVQAQASVTAPRNWCVGGVAWQVVGSNVQDPGCFGVYALDIEGVVVRYGSFKVAEEARGTRAATYWFEPAATAAQGAQQPARQQDMASNVMVNWNQWCSGTSPIVFSNAEGALNVGTLANVVPSCGGGTIVVLEPWRPGCQPPHNSNVNCNVGKAWLFSSWLDAISWLDANQWTEGSLWYRPAETVPVSAYETCVKWLVPSGTAINTVVGAADPCEGLEPPPWIVSTVTNPVSAAAPVTNSPVEERLARVEQSVDEVKKEVSGLQALFTKILCIVNPDDDLCAD